MGTKFSKTSTEDEEHFLVPSLELMHAGVSLGISDAFRLDRHPTGVHGVHNNQKLNLGRRSQGDSAHCRGGQRIVCVRTFSFSASFSSQLQRKPGMT